MSDTSSRNLRTPEIPPSKFPNPRFFAYLCRIKIRHDMLLSNLTAISPVDGRYRKVTERLADYFSEYALIRYRVRVEVEYFIALCELPLPELKGIGTTAFERLRGLYRDFSTADAERVKEIERTTNHDVKAVAVTAKFGGATGNFNAHHVAYPAVDWIAFANRFVGNTLGLTRSQYTTQIEHYDNLAALFDALKRIDTILIDLCRDMWTYISMEYFKQRIKAGEIGSSAMPHKVNPIDFENAEGNLGIANALYEHLAGKLPVSRMQRDLTDSTVLRNVGVPVAHTLLAVASLMKGLGKVILNEEALRRDLDDNWAVVAEGIQTVLRRAGYPSPYEALKALTRTNTHITAEAIAAFIAGLDVSEEVKAELRAITPASYTGIDF